MYVCVYIYTSMERNLQCWKCLQHVPLTTKLTIYHSNIGGYLKRTILEGPRILSHPIIYYHSQRCLFQILEVNVDM